MVTNPLLVADSPIYASPSVADGLVFVQAYGGSFYALNETTGTLTWKRSAKSGASLSLSLHSAQQNAPDGLYSRVLTCLLIPTGHVHSAKLSPNLNYNHGPYRKHSRDCDIFATNAETTTIPAIVATFTLHCT